MLRWTYTVRPFSINRFLNGGAGSLTQNLQKYDIFLFFGLFFFAHLGLWVYSSGRHASFT